MRRPLSFARDPKKLWELYAQSEQYKIPPAVQLGIQDEVAAYCLNRGVLMFGKAVENDIQEKTRDSKNEKAARTKAARIFASWMTTQGETPKGLYRDPMAGR